MILITRNQIEFAPFVEVETIPVDSGWTAGSLVEGEYTNYVPRTQPEHHNNYRVVVGEGVGVENLDEATLDLSEFPVVKRVEPPAKNMGQLRFSLLGCSVLRSFNVQTRGFPITFNTPSEIISGTILDFTHSLIFTKASAASKSDYFYRTIGGSGVPVFNGNTHLTVQPNPDCWAAGYDLSGVPIWNSSGGSGGGSQHGGVLLAPRILVEAEHFKSPVGTVFKFMQPDGTIFSRTSVAVNSRPTGNNHLETTRLNDIVEDIRVHVLDSAVPAGIKTYPVVGSWATVEKSVGSPSAAFPWRTSRECYLPLACLYLDQNRRAWFTGSYKNDAEISTFSVAGTTWEGVEVSVANAKVALTGVGINTDFSAGLQGSVFNRLRSGIGGDSGSALFVPLSGSSLAVLTCLTVPGGGPSYEEARINAIIASACANAGISPITVTVAPDPTTP